MRPHTQKPTRLPCLWDSPGKNTGMGCHFLLQCRKVKSESEVAQSCRTLSDPMDYSLPGSSVHGIFQARVRSGVPLLSPFFALTVIKATTPSFNIHMQTIANKLNLQYQLLLAKGNTWSFSQLLTKFSWSAVGRFGKCGMWWLWQTFTS